MTVAEAGLRSIPEGLYLASVIRHGRKVPAVSPDWGILPGDLLEFTGVPEGLQNFCERTGLQLVGSDEEALPAHVMGARGSVDARRRRASHTGMPYASLGATPGRLVARSMAAGAPAPPEEPRGEEGSRNGMAPAGRASVGTGAGRGSKGGVASLRAGPDAPSEGSRRGRRGGESAGGAVSVEGFGRSGFSLLRGRVRAGADIVGRRLKEVGFRGRFGASVVAIRRRGNHVEGKLGQVVLEVRKGIVRKER